MHHTTKLVHRLLILGTGLLVIVSCLLAGTAWRLAQGPIDCGWMAARIRTAIADDAAASHVSFAGVVLAWEGFHKGADHPLDLRLSDIVITDLSGRPVAAAPAAHLTVSPAALLLGRIVLRTVELDHATATVTRGAGGDISLGLDFVAAKSTLSGPHDLRTFREQLSRPVGSDRSHAHGVLDQLQRVHFRDADLTFHDLESGLVVRTSSMALDLVRIKGGRIQASLRAPLILGDQTAELVAETNWAPDATNILRMKLSPLRPANLSGLPPNLAFLKGLNVPISFIATVAFDRGFVPKQIQALIQIDQGQVKVGGGTIPVREGTVTLSGTLDRIDITKGRLDVAHTPDGNPEIVDISATIVHASNRRSASVALELSEIDVADLPLLWPSDVGKGARSWIIENITSGMVTHGMGSFVIESDDELNNVVVTKATGDLTGSNGAFTWIDNMPPVEQAAFRLHLVDPDILDIFISSAHQRVRIAGPDLAVKDGQMRITGLSGHDQAAVVHAQVEGQTDSSLSLLSEPRLHLLSDHPIALKVGGGDISASLSFQFPLESALRVDDIQLHVDAHLKRIRLLDVAGGHELTDGLFDIGVDKEGLSGTGQGSLAGIPVMIEGAMDFKSGPPDQIVQKIVVNGQPDAIQLNSIGLHVTDIASGVIPMTAVSISRRNGEGTVALTSDLTPTTLSVGPLAWNKPSGKAANASANLLISHNRLTKVDRIVVHGDGLLVAGSANFADGRVRSVLLDNILFDRTHGHGTVRLAANEAISIVLQGDQIDLSSKLTEKATARNRQDVPRPTSPDWKLDARFNHVILADEASARDVLAKVTGTGDQIRLLDVVGSTSGSSGFSIKIESEAGKRHLLVTAKDAGSFLRGIDASQAMQSGQLAINGTLSRPIGLYPIEGSAFIDAVLIKNSPVLGKLLQAITLYGLVDALRGPGMEFSHVVVPFIYDGSNLDVDQAYAENPSLGLTLKGRIGLSGRPTSLSGTIVPAYFFNSILGQLPLVGRLFSPETGGGVFAVRFSLDGPIADPSISINPVSALTPGFLREVFGIFDRPPAVRTPDPTAGP